MSRDPEQLRVRQLDYESRVPGDRPLGFRFLLVAVGGGAAGFFASCILTFIDVKFDPAWLSGFGWLVLPLFLLAIGLAAAVVLRQPGQPLRGDLVFAAVLVASVIAILLIIFLGIPFHFAIGGKL